MGIVIEELFSNPWMPGFGGYNGHLLRSGYRQCLLQLTSHGSTCTFRLLVFWVLVLQNNLVSVVNGE